MQIAQFARIAQNHAVPVSEFVRKDFSPSGVVPSYPTFLPASSDIPLLPADLLRSDEFVPFNLEWESLDDQLLLEK
jgi:hypothetical protein